jgi:Nitrile hydratase, alpha chain
MLNLNEIKNQTYMNSENVTPKEAAEMSKAERWAPHASDGLDAFEKAIARAEIEKWSQVVAEAWSDDEFKARLMQDPSSALKEFGIEVPAGVEIRVVEDTDRVKYVTLPPKPVGDAAKLPEGESGAIPAGFTVSTSFALRLPQTWADTWVAITA